MLFSYDDLRWSLNHSSPPLTGSAKVVQPGEKRVWCSGICLPISSFLRYIIPVSSTVIFSCRVLPFFPTFHAKFFEFINWNSKEFIVYRGVRSLLISCALFSNGDFKPPSTVTEQTIIRRYFLKTPQSPIQRYHEVLCLKWLNSLLYGHCYILANAMYLTRQVKRLSLARPLVTIR